VWAAGTALGLLVAVSSASDVGGSADAESLSNELNSDRSDVELDMCSTASSSVPATMHKRMTEQFCRIYHVLLNSTS